jgi:NitT/TauT family transport system ATP-binding protein
MPSKPRYMPDNASVVLLHLDKSYHSQGKQEVVFRNFSLAIERGEKVSILGASGCGKTTLLNLIAGIEKQDAGEMRLKAGRIGYMFQTDRLLPWRTAEHNALLGLELCGKNIDADSRNQLGDYFDRLGLAGAQNKYPATLSGGMRQRVALIRTLLYDPDVLLLDEPFSALDYAAKLSLEAEVLQFVLARTRTIVFVTHDIDEAIGVGTRLIVLGGNPAKNKPAEVVWDSEIRFASDVAGRNPVTVREDPQFAQYVGSVLRALNHANPNAR